MKNARNKRMTELDEIIRKVDRIIIDSKDSGDFTQHLLERMVEDPANADVYQSIILVVQKTSNDNKQFRAQLADVVKNLVEHNRATLNALDYIYKNEKTNIFDSDFFNSPIVLKFGIAAVALLALYIIYLVNPESAGFLKWLKSI